MIHHIFWRALDEITPNTSKHSPPAPAATEFAYTFTSRMVSVSFAHVQHVVVAPVPVRTSRVSKWRGERVQGSLTDKGKASECKAECKSQGVEKSARIVHSHGMSEGVASLIFTRCRVWHVLHYFWEFELEDTESDPPSRSRHLIQDSELPGWNSDLLQRQVEMLMQALLLPSCLRPLSNGDEQPAAGENK